MKYIHCKYKVTTLDETGILASNWSGLYAPNMGPAQWLGSLPILERFMASKKPVGYAHCYVLAAVAISCERGGGWVVVWVVVWEVVVWVVVWVAVVAG